MSARAISLSSTVEGPPESREGDQVVGSSFFSLALKEVIASGEAASTVQFDIKPGSRSWRLHWRGWGKRR